MTSHAKKISASSTTETLVEQDVPLTDNAHKDGGLHSTPPARAFHLPPPKDRRDSSSDTISLLSNDELHLIRNTSHPKPPTSLEDQSDKTPLRRRSRAFWFRNKGVIYVLLAQVFAVGMNVTTRFLELEGEGMHPFQILFARMSITMVLSLLYMWWKKIPDAPFGAKGVRALLAARGIGGFFGVFGLYWSLQYLPLADATVIGFLSPTLASYACSKLLAEPFTRVEKIAGGLSFLGVVLIARPASLFGSSTTGSPTDAGETPIDRLLLLSRAVAATSDATPTQRLSAIGMLLLSVLGSACAYTTIKWIGQRAHPLVSVNYFASWCTAVSLLALTVVPDISFSLPATPRQWGLLFALGTNGFVMQFLLTEGLRYERGSRAQNMLYSQMLFALASDRVIFGTSPGGWSIVGSALILGGAVWVALQKAQAQGQVGGAGEGARREVGAPRDEEEEASGLMAGVEMDTLDGGGKEEGVVLNDVEEEEIEGRV